MKKLVKALTLSLVLMGGAWLYQVIFKDVLFSKAWKVVIWAIFVGFLLEYTSHWFVGLFNSRTKPED